MGLPAAERAQAWHSCSAMPGKTLGGFQLPAELMAGAGSVDVSNMQGGFASAPDRMTGQIAVLSWSQLQLPVETDVNPSNGYEALEKARA